MTVAGTRGKLREPGGSLTWSDSPQVRLILGGLLSSRARFRFTGQSYVSSIELRISSEFVTR